MHELSIVQNIIQIVSSCVEKDKIGLVDKIYLKFGRLSNILTDSLCFSYNSIVENTPLKNSSLVIDILPIKIECKDCNEISTTNNFVFCCPLCESNSISVIGGDELIITSIQLVDESK